MKAHRELEPPDHTSSLEYKMLFEAYLEALAQAEKLAAALEKVKTYIGGCRLTGFPEKVRELDGSISTHYPKTSEGRAYDLSQETLAEFQKWKDEK